MEYEMIYEIEIILQFISMSTKLVGLKINFEILTCDHSYKIANSVTVEKNNSFCV